MSQTRLKWVRELMIDGEYEAARALLDTLDRDTAALMLRAELEELAPSSPAGAQDVGTSFLASVPQPNLFAQQRGWEYCELAWRITSFTEGIPGAYALADAILHRFSLISREYADLNADDLAVSSIDFRIGKPLVTYGEIETNSLRARFGDDPQEIARYFEEQPEAFRATQPIILNELNALLEIAVRAHLMRLGEEGWEWIGVRERPPDAWADLHENVRIGVSELCSLYLLKRRRA
jgi:hypothetical protein